MPIPLYILKRLIYVIPTILMVSIIGFLLMRWNFDFGTYEIPTFTGETMTVALERHIDPLAEFKLNPQISREVYEAERERLGLDKPLHIQYWLWLKNLLFHFNLGKTFNGDDVATLLMKHAGNTLLLNVLVIGITWMVALPLGVYAALRWRSVTDRMLTVLATVGMAAPGFVVAILLAVFAVGTGILPVGGLTSDNFASMSLGEKVIDLAQHLILPVMVLTFVGIAGIQRQMRGNLLDVLQAEYVRVARAKGLPENQVIYKHAVRTAINPIVTMLGYEFSALLSGAVLVEIVLGYPGLGHFTYKAVLDTDTNVVMASLVMSAFMLMLGNLFADILLKFVDPRIELA